MSKNDQELGRAMYRAMQADKITQHQQRRAGRLAAWFFLGALLLICISGMLWMALK